MTAFPSFRPQSLQFLRGLARHNQKAWFENHRATYEGEVLGPLRELVEEMDVQFARFAPEIIGHPKRSIFRIYRDVRFSADKSPYKTHAAAWFYHRDASKSVGSGGGGAGFYFHLEPGASFVGGGIWMPPRESLTRIRDAIVDGHPSFERIVTARPFTRRFGTLSDEAMLKRLPRGFTEETPGARWLRYQSFTVGRALADDEVLRPDLPKVLVREYTTMLPLVRWLNGALGYAPTQRR
jgi:uncharacterized protein (TIGR02453 family)